MNLQVAEQQILDEIESRDYDFSPHADWYTPSGEKRSCPMYSVDIENEYLGIKKVVKSKSEKELTEKVNAQLEEWAAQELQQRLQSIKDDQENLVCIENARIAADRKQISNILNATLSIDDRIDWEEMKDTSEFPKFAYGVSSPQKPGKPIPNFWQKAIPFLFDGAIEEFTYGIAKYEREKKCGKQTS